MIIVRSLPEKKNGNSEKVKIIIIIRRIRITKKKNSKFGENEWTILEVLQRTARRENH